MEIRTTVLVHNLQFPESPRWHAGKLWCCDLFAQRVIQIDLQGGVQTVVELPDTPTGLGWTPGGRLLVVSALNRQLLRLEDHGLVEIADMSGIVSHPCNDMVVDALGRAYIGNMGFDFGNPQAVFQPGPILLVMPDGTARVVASGLAFPNGMVISPDGQTLIVAESHAARLTAFNIESDGSLSHHRIWACFDDPEGQITPDGMCLDVEGAVWVASPGTRQVLRVHEGSEITYRVQLDTIPLACILGGPERRTLFVATKASLDPNVSDTDGRIETLQVDVPGTGWP